MVFYSRLIQELRSYNFPCSFYFTSKALYSLILQCCICVPIWPYDWPSYVPAPSLFSRVLEVAALFCYWKLKRDLMCPIFLKASKCITHFVIGVILPPFCGPLSPEWRQYTILSCIAVVLSQFEPILYTLFINGSRMEQPGLECMNTRLGRIENTWRAHRLVFHLRIFDENFSQRERLPFMNRVFMASSSPSHPPVILSEDDILGASVAGRNPTLLKNVELMLCLWCRGDLLKGLKRKAQPIKRYACSASA